MKLLIFFLRTSIISSTRQKRKKLKKSLAIFINKDKEEIERYEEIIYEINQQATDDLRVLKSSAILDVNKLDEPTFPNERADFFVYLPSDYFHLLNCIVQFKKDIPDDNPCPSAQDKGYLMVPARKLTSDMYPSILVNAYYKPTYKNPYFFINNVAGTGRTSEAEELARILNPCKEILPPTPGGEGDVENGTKMQIRCGSSYKYTPTKVFIDYVRNPKKMYLSYSDLELINGVDKSMEMEFPDYVCYEIINELVKLVMENASDPRLQTNVPINQTIATPSDNK